MQLQPATGAGRTVLLVLFVLLTLAAVVVGVFVLRGLAEAREAPNSAPRGAPAGTVVGWEGVQAGPVVPGDRRSP